MSIEVTCWGTRGSVPVSGPRYVEYGGRTTCLEIAFPAAHEDCPERIIIDCGTGLVELGHQRNGDFSDVLLLQTHMHWDHVQGFPFFAPFYDPEARFDFWGVDRGGSTLEEVYRAQMTEPTFPISLDTMVADVDFDSLPETGERQLGDVTLRWDELRHPSGSSAFRIERGDDVFCFSGDVEVRKGCRASLEALARDADVLLMDAQYFPSEYAAHEGFGHSTCEDAVEVAEACGVGRLYLTHHDPAHDDARLDEKAAMARRAAGSGLQVENARDDLTIVV